MLVHVRANLWLLLLTVVLCSILYPLVILGIGQTVFHDKAEGSLVTDSKGGAIGSELIAQPFSSGKYFSPRPSATTPSYNAAASGPSNLSANNPLLRDQVMSRIGPVLKYKNGNSVGPDVVTWFREQIGKDRKVLDKWTHDQPGLATVWAGSDDKVGNFLKEWGKTHQAAIETWKAANPDSTEVKPENIAPLFLESYAKGESTTWPEVDDAKDIQTAFFCVWWPQHSDAKVQPIPADMVTTSGSGLDPDITLDNALYQLDGVAAAWAKETKGDEAKVRDQVKAIVLAYAGAPLNGLVGEPLVNVLQVNLALRKALQPGL